MTSQHAKPSIADTATDGWTDMSQDEDRFVETQNAKYIVFDGGMCTSAVVFSDTVTHSDMDVPGTPIGAGFCTIRAENGELSVSAFGHSTSLKLKSRGEEDAKVIKRIFERILIF